MEEKVMRQLRRAMQPALTDITVTWNAPPHRQVQPAPFRLPPLFCGGRLVVYGILDNSSSSSSSKGDDDEVEVVVSAKTAVKPFEARVKVDMKKATAGNLLNKLAAKALLRYGQHSDLWRDSTVALTTLCGYKTETWKREGATYTTSRADRSRVRTW
jgi:hypothetical protein